MLRDSWISRHYLCIRCVFILVITVTSVLLTMSLFCTQQYFQGGDKSSNKDYQEYFKGVDIHNNHEGNIPFSSYV
jgi:hypothetical protein